MEQPIPDLAVLPYTLRRPFFTFFRFFTKALIAIVILAALIGGGAGFLIAAAIGGSLWFGFAMGVVFNRQKLTLEHDHLLFESSGKQYRVSYHDIRQVEVEEITGVRSYSLTLWLYHVGVDPSPLDINFKLLKAADRVLLLRVLERLAPQAELKALAKEFLAGKLRLV